MADTQIKFDQMKAEKDELVEILDKRNKEIQKLNSDVSNYSEQLQSATSAKIEALVKVDELTSKEMELDYKYECTLIFSAKCEYISQTYYYLSLFMFLREKQLGKEKDWVSKQVQLLNDELDRKSREIIEIQRDNNLRYLTLQTDVSDKAEQVSNLITERLCS